jgi:hypothetical protein
MRAVGGARDLIDPRYAEPLHVDLLAKAPRIGRTVWSKG